MPICAPLPPASSPKAEDSTMQTHHTSLYHSSENPKPSNSLFPFPGKCIIQSAKTCTPCNVTMAVSQLPNTSQTVYVNELSPT